MKLKPCPFCGSNPFVIQVVDEIDCRYTVIKCQKCGVELKWEQFFYSAPVKLFAPVEDNKQIRLPVSISAEEAWNRRMRE